MTRAQAIRQLTAVGADYELREQNINDIPCRVFVNAPTSLRELYASTRSDAPFVIYQDESYTFAVIYGLAAQLATALVETYEIKKGDRVAISMRNYPEWIVAFSAITSIGAIAVAMNAWWEADEIEMGLNDCGAKVILADAQRIAKLAQCSDALQVEVISVRTELGTNGIGFDTLIADIAPDTPMPQADVNPDDPATIFYTSGSTGFPKGAVASHRNIISALLSWELDGHAGLLIAGVGAPEPVSQPATLLAVPLFHATGSHAVYLSSYRAQRKIVSMYKWDPAQAADLIEREKITSFVAPAAMTGDLVMSAQKSNRDLSSLLTVGGGGAPRAPEQVKDIDDSFATAMPNTGWGMTETNAIGTGIGGLDYLNRPESSGRASAVLDLKVVDDDGNQCTQGERGELLIRGVSVIKEYWERPQANADTFIDGWLRTGDVAYFDAEGFLFIVDRIKDLIIRGGENIGCGEVEAALVEHPFVVEACVYAVPDNRLGEEVGASIYASHNLSEIDLRSFLEQRLAKFKIPTYMRFQAEPLARIASGKIFKRQIRDQAIDGIMPD